MLNIVINNARNDEMSPQFFWGSFGETDTFPKIYQRGNGNFRFPSISQINLLISLKFLSKNYGEILVFFAVKLSLSNREFKMSQRFRVDGNIFQEENNVTSQSFQMTHY